MKNEAQHALDDLWNEKLIPFRLIAHNVRAEGDGIYTVHFFDSRFHSVSVFWKEGKSFKKIIQVAVLRNFPKSRDVLNSSFAPTFFDSAYRHGSF